MPGLGECHGVAREAHRSRSVAIRPTREASPSWSKRPRRMATRPWCGTAGGCDETNVGPLPTLVLPLPQTRRRPAHVPFPACAVGWGEPFFKWAARQNLILYNPASQLELPRIEKRLPKAALTTGERVVPSSWRATGCNCSTSISTGARSSFVKAKAKARRTAWCLSANERWPG